MEPKYRTPEQALNALKREFGEIYDISAHLDYVHPSHLYNYYCKYRKKVSPTLIKVLREKGYIEKRIRSQITWENVEQKKAFEWYVKSIGRKSISEYCRELADSNMEAYRNDQQIDS